MADRPASGRSDRDGRSVPLDMAQPAQPLRGGPNVNPGTPRVKYVPQPPVPGFVKLRSAFRAPGPVLDGGVGSRRSVPIVEPAVRCCPCPGHRRRGFGHGPFQRRSRLGRGRSWGSGARYGPSGHDRVGGKPRPPERFRCGSGPGPSPSARHAFGAGPSRGSGFRPPPLGRPSGTVAQHPALARSCGSCGSGSSCLGGPGSRRTLRGIRAFPKSERSRAFRAKDTRLGTVAGDRLAPEPCDLGGAPEGDWVAFPR